MSSIICKSVEFDVVLDNIKDFKEFHTNVFYVSGQPWDFQFIKRETNTGGSNSSSLDVYLHSKCNDQSNQWFVAAAVSYKLISSTVRECLFEKGTSVFCSSFMTIRWPISWAELMNPEKGFIVDDRCKIQVAVKATPLQNNAVQMEYVQQCDPKSFFSHFRLSINLSDDFIGVTSPTFMLGSTTWRITITKMDQVLSSKLVAALYRCKSTTIENVITCKSLKIKLISTDQNVQPAEIKVGKIVFPPATKSSNIILIDWNDFLNPEKRFVVNASFTIEIEMEIDGEGELKVPIIKQPASDAVELECPICLESLIGRDIVTTKCGHMFCDPCIKASLRLRKICPTCTVKVTNVQLRKVFLPTKK